MFAVVILRWSGDVSALANAAAQALGQTAYEVRASLQSPDCGPAVMGVLADPEVARQRAEALVRAGFAARVVRVERELQALAVRSFTLSEQGLAAQARDQHQAELRYTEIDRLVQATWTKTTRRSKTVREQKFSVTRTLLSGGLVSTKGVERQETTTNTESDDLLFVFGGDEGPLRFVSKELDYRGLGPAMEPSRTASFAKLVAELRRRCPHARFDGRLRRSVSQAQTLGRTLSPEDYLDFAVTLVAESMKP